MSYDVCILLATARRPALLRQTLESLAAQQLGGITMCTLVVDNAGDEASRAVVEELASRMDVRYLVELRRGKSAALNTGLAALPACELLVLTDDDIVADAGWIAALWAALARWPAADIFGGRILPRYPDDKRGIDIERVRVRIALAVQDDDGVEKLVPHGKIWGANLAVRSRVLANGIRFNEAIGPTGSEYITGCEVDFTRRLETAGSTCVFVPTAAVGHVIRDEQLTAQWLRGRAYKQGRGEAVRNPIAGQKTWRGIPRWILRDHVRLLLRRCADSVSRAPPAARLDTQMDLEFSRGLIAQYAAEYRRARATG